MHRLQVRRKQFAVGIALALSSILFALVLAEIAARVAGVAPAPPAQYADNIRDEGIIFRRRPGSVARGRSESGEYSFHYAHNSLGFRDREHALAKPAGTVRIVAVGDSFTYGVGADQSDTYLAQVEQRLNGRDGTHRPVEIINLGLPSQFPAVERLTLERYGLRFAPDVVLVTLLPNDVVDTQRGPDAICVSESGYLVTCSALRWGAPAVWLGVHSALGRMVLRTWSQRWSGDIGEAWPDLFVDDGPFEAAWREVERELGYMQQAARAHGAAFVVMALPQRPPWQGMHAYPEVRLRRWCTAHDAVFVPTLAALRAADSTPPLYWPRDGHCTPAGYEVIANTLATALIAHGLVP